MLRCVIPRKPPPRKRDKLDYIGVDPRATFSGPERCTRSTARSGLDGL